MIKITKFLIGQIFRVFLKSDIKDKSPAQKAAGKCRLCQGDTPYYLYDLRHLYTPYRAAANSSVVVGKYKSINELEI